MYFWIIANNTTGQIGTGSGTHAPDETLAPVGFSLLGTYDDASNPMPSDFEEAYNAPGKYLYQNSQFVAQPYFTLIFANGTVNAALNNPPASPPAQVTFSALGQTYTETLTNGQATLALTLHPAIAGQQINVEVSATDCVSETLNIGGNGSFIPMKIVTTTTPNTISPVYRSDGEAYYANVIPPETLFADIGTANSLVTHFAFDKVPAALRLLNSLITWAKSPTYAPFSPSDQDTADVATITLTADELNGLSDVEANLMPSLYTTLANAYPHGGTKQLQYARYVADSQTSYTSFSDYVRDVQTLGWQ
jgi:hypothetical protein